jgi:alkylated DNA nucleotide flippase Atl1
MSARTRTRPAGRVSALFIKPERGEPMEPVEAGRARRGSGLIGDCHAKPLGPRQVLVVREEELEDLDVAPWQVRANIALRGLGARDLASGRVLRFERGPQVRITHECEVCKVLRKYVRPEVFANLPGRRGSLGVIIRGGQIEPGDRVGISRVRYPEVPERIYDRLAWVLARVPRGRVVMYDTLIELVGASRPYFRVLPTYVKRAHANRLPAHRVLTSAAALTGRIPGQENSLRREGVNFDATGHLQDPGLRWEGKDLYLRR